MSNVREAYACVRVRPESLKVIRKLAKTRYLKQTAVVDVLVRAWTQLTPEQQEAALTNRGVK